MKLKIVLVTLIALFSATSFACDYHGLNFGVFGPQVGGGQFHQTAKPPELEVTHPESVTVSKSEQKSIRVRYYQPSAYKNIEVFLDGGEDVKLTSSDSVSLDKLFGAFNLDFEALTVGEHQIKVTVKGLVNNRPYYHVQNMKVISQ